MPIKSARQFGMMAAKAHDSSNVIGGPSKEVAMEMVHKTPKETRSKFAKILASKRKKKWIKKKLLLIY